MKYPLKHQNIHPGLVIGQNQIPFRTFQSLYPLNFPSGVAGNQSLVLVVDPDPIFGDGIQNPTASSPPGFQRDRHFGEHQHKQRYAPEHCVQNI
jgi:hypothetical protein